MRELSACDFCGGETAGVYEVVPGDIPGVSARRMVLCEDCRDTLADIVDPLLEAGRAGGRAKQESEAGTGTEAGAPASGASESPVEPAAARKSAAETNPKPDAAPAAGPNPDSAAEPEPEPDAEPTSDPGPVENPEPEADSQSAEGGSAEPEPVERPSEYGKVVRLVENRDDGIPRSDLEELATSAYGLSHGDVEEAIDFAIEHGTFQETDRGLKTT